MTAILTKRMKAEDLYPPHELRDNTKARRAWVAAKIVELSKQPNTEARSVGTGSYQHVSVWKTFRSEGRIRERGTCQGCGGKHVVPEDGRIVLHGYKRPGYGYTIGRCYGAGEKPAEMSVAVTEETIKLLGDTANRLEQEAFKLGATWNESGRWLEMPRGLEYKYEDKRHKRIRELSQLIRANRDYAMDLTKHVLPQLGADFITEVVPL